VPSRLLPEAIAATATANLSTVGVTVITLQAVYRCLACLAFARGGIDSGWGAGAATGARCGHVGDHGQPRRRSGTGVTSRLHRSATEVPALPDMHRSRLPT
jgi:hypothetical protein